MSDVEKERRQHVRYPLLLIIDYGDNNHPTEWTENISGGGLFIQTHRQVERGTSMEFSISFPGVMKPVEIRGNVAWCRPGSAWLPPGIGIHASSGLEALKALAGASTSTSTGESPNRYRIVTMRTAVKPPAGRDFDIVSANTGDEAKQLASTKRPDLLITDLYTPLADSLQMIKDLRRSLDTPILAVSSGDRDDDMRAAMAGVTAVIEKRGHVRHILETIKILRRMGSLTD